MTQIQIQFLTLGEFGHAVAQQAARAEDRIDPFPLTDDARLADLIAAARFVAVATWRPYPDAMQRLAVLCRASATPWSVAECYGTRLTVGPLVVPGGTGCYACYRKRWGAHHPAPERERVLQDFYARHADAGPDGYSPPSVAFAASALRLDASRAQTEGAAASGRFRVVDLLTVSVLESQVLPVHGCPTCFPKAAKAKVGGRFTRHLVPALKEIRS